MKIIKSLPPNIDKIRKHLSPNEGTVFTYGDTLYNPSGNPVSEDLLAHEQIHSLQQGDNPEKWWNEYLADPQFRLDQETEAYRQQYHVFCSSHKDRNMQARFLHRIASDLASPMYGWIVDYGTAIRRIGN